jgi:uncharacterized protein with PIN domain
MVRRFLADVMLERLARWLRVIGADVESAPGAAADRDRVRRATAEDRVLLTRDRRLAADHAGGAAAGDIVVVRSAPPLQQLAEVVERFDVPVGELFTRCLLCNVPLEPAPDVDGANVAPARRCPRCGRVYWEGSHTRRMRAALARALPQARASLVPPRATPPTAGP